MTMTPIDPPGPCAYGEVIDVVLSAEPALVAIEFLPNGGGGAWDVVYADGRFSYRYRDSTRDGTTFHIRPPGDYWPCPFRVHYEPAVPTGGQTWGTIYAPDLAAETTRVCAPGSHTIGGVTWWVKGVASGQSAGATNGTGLYIQSNFGVDNSDQANPSLRWFLPLANVPGFNPNAPVAVWARATCASWYWHVGFMSAAASSAQITNAERASRTGVGHAAGNTTAIQYVNADAVGQVSVRSDLQPLPDEPSLAVGIALVGRNLGLRNWSPWSGSWTPPDPYTFRRGITDAISSTQHGLFVVAPDMDLSKVGIFFSYNAGNPVTFYLRNLYVMQPKVSA